MKVLVFGGTGRIGSAVAWDLARYGGVDFVGIASRSGKALEKTIRWPGHWQAIDTLKECGLLDLEPVSFAGGTVRPREFFLSLVEPRLRPLPGDEDVCVMWNTAVGEEKRADYCMWTGADTANGISAMARVTGFSAAIAARLLGIGEIREKGIVAPEDCITGGLYKRFMKDLAKRGIIVLEALSSSGE